MSPRRVAWLLSVPPTLGVSPSAGGVELEGMANQKDRKDEEVVKEDRSAAPPGWPGIPGRSAEHDGHSQHGDEREHKKDADVTEQQRDLERKTRR